MEEHTVTGGFSGAVAEVLAEMKNTHAPLVRLGLKDLYASVVGSGDYLCDFYDISADKVAKRILEACGK